MTTRPLAFGLASLLCTGCVAAPSPTDDGSAEQARGDFDDAMADLQDEYGQDGKADLFGIDPCHYLEPIFSEGNDLSHLGLFVGIEGDGALGVAVGFGGFDIVWDLYHQQMTVSRYFGAGVATLEAGVSVTAYAGVAVGFSHSVSDWDGYFVSANADVGLPFLKDYLSLTPEIFVSGVDSNGDQIIEPGEMLLPPQGVYGFNIGVSLGFDLLPDPLPVAPAVTEGLWEPYKPAIAHFYHQLAETRFAHIGRHLRVHLVDEENGGECPEAWPDVEGERECVVEFGEPDWSYTHNGAHLAYGICSVLGGCEIPLSWPMSATAVAIGAFRDVGGNVAALCPNL